MTDRIANKAWNIAERAGHNNLPYSMGVRMALTEESDPREIQQINPEFYSADFWKEMISGYDFAKAILN